MKQGVVEELSDNKQKSDTSIPNEDLKEEISSKKKIEWNFPPPGATFTKNTNSEEDKSGDSTKTELFNFNNKSISTSPTLNTTKPSAFTSSIISSIGNSTTSKTTNFPSFKIDPSKFSVLGNSTKGLSSTTQMATSSIFSGTSSGLRTFSSSASSENIFPAGTFNFTFNKGSLFGNKNELEKPKSPAPITTISVKPVEVKTGEEEEERVFSIRARLFKLETKCDHKKWREKGVGQLHVNYNRAENGSRLVLRSEGVLRLVLNVSLYPSMTLKRAQDKSILFTAYEKEGLSSFLIRVSRKDEATQLLNILNEYKGKRARDSMEQSNVPDAKRAKKVEQSGENEEKTIEEKENNTSRDNNNNNKDGEVAFSETKESLEGNKHTEEDIDDKSGEEKKDHESITCKEGEKKEEITTTTIDNDETTKEIENKKDDKTIGTNEDKETDELKKKSINSVMTPTAQRIATTLKSLESEG